MRVLVIDDNPDHRELIISKIRKAYPDAEFVEIIRQAMLDKALENGAPPDVVLTDYRLQWSDGLKVLAQVRGRYLDVPVIMVTDTGSEEVAAAGMKGGLADYVLKDHLNRLPLTFRESLEKTRLRAERERERTELIREQAARAAAEASERHYRSLAEAIPQMVWTARADGRIDYYNRRWFEYTGMREEDAFNEDAWLSVLHPDDVAPVRERWRRAVLTGEVYEVECRICATADGSYRWHLCRAVPLRDDGHIAKWFGTSTDIDDQKRSNEAIREAQRLESIGLLAGGVAHDFNNLLTGIMGNTSLALEALEDGGEARPMLENVLLASERAADLTRQLLAYSGKGRFFVQASDLSVLVREIGSLIQSSIPKKVQLNLDLAPDLPLVDVDTAQMQQLIMNLVINGAEAIGEDRSGTVSVSTRLREIDQKYIANNHFAANPVPPGWYVAIQVRDDGCGMDESVRSRIFEPFFTTKFTGRGLGLAAAMGIVRGHHGGIRIESEPGKGTLFEVLLPAGKAVRRPRPEPAPVARELRGAGSVLVIDDEDLVRKVAKAALGHYGYDVLQAENGLEGVEMFRRHADRISVVLLDMMMPVMSGEEALVKIRAIRPDVPVIGSSGYSESVAKQRFGGKGLAAFLQKPYSAQVLADRVKLAMERQTAEA